MQLSLHLSYAGVKLRAIYGHCTSTPHTICTHKPIKHAEMVILCNEKQQQGFTCMLTNFWLTKFRATKLSVALTFAVGIASPSPLVVGCSCHTGDISSMYINLQYAHLSCFFLALSVHYWLQIKQIVQVNTISPSLPLSWAGQFQAEQLPKMWQHMCR